MRLRNRLIALGCAGRRGVGRQFLRWTSYSSNCSLARATAALSPRVAALRLATRPEPECDPSRFETMPWTGSGWRWQADKLRRSGAPTAPCLRSVPMTSAGPPPCSKKIKKHGSYKSADRAGLARTTCRISLLDGIRHRGRRVRLGTRRGSPAHGVVPIIRIASNGCFRGQTEFEFPDDPCSSPLQATPIHVVSECEGLAPAAPSPPSGHASQTPSA